MSNLAQDLARYYASGGWVMHPISVCLVLSMTVIVYKLLVFRRVRGNVNEFMARVRSALLRGNVEDALQVSEESHSPIAAVTKAGLLKIGARRAQVERSMENAASQQLAHLEKFLAVLASVTHVAPLLGFLGTVVGMIGSFEVIAEQGLNNPGLVAEGISQALVTTAYGLIVAFLTQPFYSYFSSRIASYTRQIEGAANILLETLDETAP